MNYDMETIFFDFCEYDQSWHWASERVDENESWKNIGYGKKIVVRHFCTMVDILTHDFGMKFTTDQIVRLAECTPGLTVFSPTAIPEGSFEQDVHMNPIFSKESIEEHLEWKQMED